MLYVILDTDAPRLLRGEVWEVGYEDTRGRWRVHSTHGTESEARARATQLNKEEEG